MQVGDGSRVGSRSRKPLTFSLIVTGSHSTRAESSNPLQSVVLAPAAGKLMLHSRRNRPSGECLRSKAAPAPGNGWDGWDMPMAKGECGMGYKQSARFCSALCWQSSSLAGSSLPRYRFNTGQRRPRRPAWPSVRAQPLLIPVPSSGRRSRYRRFRSCWSAWVSAPGTRGWRGRGLKVAVLDSGFSGYRDASGPGAPPRRQSPLVPFRRQSRGEGQPARYPVRGSDPHAGARGGVAAGQLGAGTARSIPRRRSLGASGRGADHLLLRSSCRPGAIVRGMAEFTRS